VRGSTHAEYVELRIIDHGRGLKKHTADSAFAPFQRLGDRDNTPGIGLGLSVAKGFAEAMDGTIRAEDTPGGGLTVVISLRAYAAPQVVPLLEIEERVR
jgi:two-component system sensor histidine kinase KdpD